ncbi:ThuA domain-containing protein [Sinomonas gamaensis]|uniref:ThuA domain-containing protein n=1 Tax=Sinomonas gamaensis TaxID=2565624 RepID=UPI001109522D|nr:ThuA domain-containing protein [Sinomonas gamaensis]
MTKIVFLVGEGEYESDRTMRPIADHLAAALGAEVVYKTPDVLEDMPNFPKQSFGDLSDLDDADLLVVYTRWRQLPDAEMRHIVDYCDRGGHVIGLRTSSHAFHYPPESEWAEWNDGFGRDVLGSPWISHHGHSSSTDVTWASKEGHPILEGIPESFHLRAWLYRTDLSEGCVPILWGEPVDPENEPTPSAVAWTRERPNGQRTVYTNMGHPSDLRQSIVKTFLANAAKWCLQSGAADADHDLSRSLSR